MPNVNNRLENGRLALGWWRWDLLQRRQRGSPVNHFVGDVEGPQVKTWSFVCEKDDSTEFKEPVCREAT
jgi:hypothetical protein